MNNNTDVLILMNAIPCILNLNCCNESIFHSDLRQTKKYFVLMRARSQQ